MKWNMTSETGGKLATLILLGLLPIDRFQNEPREKVGKIQRVPIVLDSTKVRSVNKNK